MNPSQKFEVIPSRGKFQVRINGEWLVNKGDGKPRRFKTQKDALIAADWATREEVAPRAVYTGPRI